MAHGASRAAYATAGAILLVLVWQVAALSGIFGDGLPTATATGSELVLTLASPLFWADAWTTIGLAAGGLVLSTVMGVVIGVLIGSFPVFRAATLAVTEFLKPIPPIVILPLAVMILGPTADMAFFLVVFGLVLAISIQTIAGVADSDPIAQSTARSYGLGRAETLWRVTLPGAMPFIATAVRVSAPSSLVIVVVAGLLGGAPGLGRSIYQAQAAGNFDTLYALVVVLGLLGLAFQGLSAVAEARVLHWHPSQRKTTP